MCFFYFFQYFIYLPFIRIEFYYFAQNFKPGRNRDVNLQRYAVNTKCQEYQQRNHTNSYSFYTRFANFFPYNVLYKEVQIFESKNDKKIFLSFSWDFKHIKTIFRRFKILVLTVDIKSPIHTHTYIYIYTRGVPPYSLRSSTPTFVIYLSIILIVVLFFPHHPRGKHMDAFFQWYPQQA